MDRSRIKEQRLKEMKPWRCQDGHVMGMVVRNGSGIRQLLLYRQALEGEKGEPVARPYEVDGDIDVMAVVEGYVADVRCSICGRIRTWVPGQESIERLLKQLGR